MKLGDPKKPGISFTRWIIFACAWGRYSSPCCCGASWPCSEADDENPVQGVREMREAAPPRGLSRGRGIVGYAGIANPLRYHPR